MRNLITATSVVNQHERSKRHRLREKTLLFLFILTLTVPVLISFPSFRHLVITSKLQCVQISNETQSFEGLGAMIKRNQFALFIAESYNTKVSFPSIPSMHGYDLGKIFDRCPTPQQKCELDQKTSIMNRCPRADCLCLRRQMRSHVARLARSCHTLLVHNDNTRTLEFSGCIRNVLTRYVGKLPKPIPKLNSSATQEWDVIHYRAGDISEKQLGKKAFTIQELYYVMREMCRRSDRDIIILTEAITGLPRVQDCNHRFVLASDTNMFIALSIAKHARTLAVGKSSFAQVMAEIASPDRMIVMERDVILYEWVPIERWTIFGAWGAEYHFDNKEFMLANSQRRSLEARSYRTKSQMRAGKERAKIMSARRHWENEYQLVNSLPPFMRAV